MSRYRRRELKTCKNLSGCVLELQVNRVVGCNMIQLTSIDQEIFAVHFLSETNHSIVFSYILLVGTWAASAHVYQIINLF
jgi:hypothetical protein